MMNSMKVFKCSVCGAILTYDKENDKYVCDFCLAEYPNNKPQKMEDKVQLSHIKNSVFEVETNNSSATCFLIQKDKSNLYFITNQHVVKDKSFITIKSFDGKHIVRCDMKKIKVSNEYDIALLSCKVLEDANYFIPIKLGNIDSLTRDKEGMKIYQYGNKKGKGLSFEEGIIGNFRGYKIMTTLKTYPGTSGSPILDKYGNVIGLHVGTDFELPYAIHGKYIKDFLNLNKISFDEDKEVYYEGL